MHATIRRYEGVDQNRIVELKTKVSESFIPKMNELRGFAGYYLIEADNGVLTSLALFENADQAEESNRIAATWIREAQLETIVPNAPKITSGKVLVNETPRVLVA